MSEILPTLSRLSKVFQTENLPFTSVKPAVESTKSVILSLHAHTSRNTVDWQKELRAYAGKCDLTNVNSVGY